MQITSELGQEIIKRIADYTDFSINIMDLDGRIVASTDLSRIGEIHSGAVEVLKTKEELVIDEGMLMIYPGTKEGVNLPIKHNDKIVGVVGVSGDPKEIYKFTGLIRTTVEIVMERIHIERQAYFKERQWSYWLHQLLHPSGFDIDRLEEEAEYSLKVNVHLDWRVILISGHIENDILQKIQREINGMKLNYLFVLPFSGDEIVIVISAVNKGISLFINRLLVLIGEECRIGIGDKGFGLVGIRNSYMLAKQALIFANKNIRVTYSQDWKLERLIAAINELEYKTVSIEFERKIEILDSNYIKTIDTFLGMNLSIKKTSEKLHIHRNTLLYRLDQIHQKVGLDPRSFYDACILLIIRNRQSFCADIQKRIDK